MEKQEKKPNALGALISLGIFIYFGYQFWGGGIENKVANDAVQEYEIAKNQGDKTQICVQAGLVSAAYLQAKDESNYQKWKTIEKQDCPY